MKLHFFVFECINKSLLCHRKRNKYTVYKMKKTVSNNPGFEFVRVDE